MVTFPPGSTASKNAMRPNDEAKAVKLFPFSSHCLPALLNVAGLARLLFLFCPFVLFALPVSAQLEDWDTDHDAMPNGWEFYRDLNVSDPRDAWSDPDQDGIPNLYEYFLGADPLDRHQPQVIRLMPGQDLATAIRNAGRGVVLQIPEGQYQLNYRTESQDDPPRILLQGGWKADFSEQDHCRFPSVLDGGGAGAVFDFFIASGNSAAVVLDGFTLMGGSAGALRYTGYLAKAQLLLANCRLIANRAHRASAILDFTDGEGATLISDLILVNTLIAGNRGTAIRSEQYATRANLKILHSLIALNESAENDDPPYTSGYGIHAVPDSDSLFFFQVVNSVLWENADAEVQISNAALPALQKDITNNIMGYLEGPVRLALFDHPSNRSIDPLLEKIDELTYRVGAQSPVKQAGIDIGFFPEVTPDIGPQLCAFSITTASTATSLDEAWRVSPNPAEKEVILSGYLPFSGKVQITWYDALGRRIQSEQQGHYPRGAFSLSLSAPTFASGLTVLEVTLDGKRINNSVIRVQLNPHY